MRSLRVKVLYSILAFLCLTVISVRVIAPDTFATRFKVASTGKTVTHADETWYELINWDFSYGQFPGEWGWGEYNIVDGALVMTDEEDAAGDFAVYFTPVEHGGDFVLETEVQLIQGTRNMPVEAHLITRDSNQLHSECGLAIFGDKDYGFLRNTIDDHHHLFGTIDMGQPITLGPWYKMRLQYLDGKLTADVNGIAVPCPQQEYPTSIYTEPHLAVTNGTARFRNIRVLSKTRFSPLPGQHHPNDLVASLSKSARQYQRDILLASGAYSSLHSEESGEQPNPVAAGLGGDILATLRSPSFSNLYPPELPAHDDWRVKVLKAIFYTIVFFVIVYVLRHFVFTLNRLTGKQRHPYINIDAHQWPAVTVLVPGHNEEEVINEILEALLDVDYPDDKIRILPINDRSTDKTAEVIDRIAALHPNRITPFHRKDGMPGKAAALKDAMELVTDDIVLIFDADYIPGRGLIKQLVSPFADPEVGAVMGRVVPYNVDENLLTRMLDLERSGGYQVDQQARMNLNLVPQYGGTVGGIRVKALDSVGGWRTDSLAEDTDATYRLLLGGWKTVYQNKSECYEQVPSSWRVRMTQIFRWALGHNQTLVRYFMPLLRNKRTRFAEKLDGALLLGIYWMSPVMLIGWIVGSLLWYLGINKPGIIIILAVTTYSTIGNSAVFFEIATAAHLDGTRGRIRLLPFVMAGFLVSLVSVTRATFTQMTGVHGKDGVFWHKTKHLRRTK